MKTETLRAGINILASELKNVPEFDAQKYELWLKIMERENVGDDELIALCYKALLSMTFFPTIGELLNLRANGLEEKSEMAWVKVLELVKTIGGFGSLCLGDVHGDGAILWTLNRLDWSEFSPSITADNLSIKRAEFVRIYKLALSAGYSNEWVVGTCERNNRANGLDVTHHESCGRSLPFPNLQELKAGRKKLIAR